MSLISTLTRSLKTAPMRAGGAAKREPDRAKHQEKSRVRFEVLYGILSGLLLTLSLPKPDLYFLAWVALVPLLFVILHEPNPRRIAAISYTAGFVFFSGTFYWMTETMIIYGGLSYAAAVGIEIGRASCRKSVDIGGRCIMKQKERTV